MKQYLKTRKHLDILAVLAALLLLALPLSGWAQFNFITNADNTITIIGYPGSGGDVAIPGSINGYPVTSIGDNAFSYCFSLTNMTIPDSVTSIGESAFFDCGLATVTFGMNVTNIGPVAFDACYSLTSVAIPDSVTTIGDEAFSDCQSLTNISVSAGNLNYASTNGVLFNSTFTTLVQYPVGMPDASYTIPDSVTSIGTSAFESCSSLTSVTIPNSVTNIGQYSFDDCTSLQQGYFLGNAPSVDGGSGSADTTVFSGESGTVCYAPGTTGWGSTFGGWPTAAMPQTPVIIDEPTNQAACVGGNTTFTALAGGQGTLGYQWYFDGSPIIGAASTSCVLSNVSTNNAGNYYVVVTNSYGSVTSSVATLTVTNSPTILMQWDLAGDWNPPANPNGAWTYGQIVNGSFSSLPYTSGAYCNGSGSGGCVCQNQQTYPTYGIDPGEISLEADWGNPAVEWTAPTSGNYAISVLIGGTAAYEGSGWGNNFAQYSGLSIDGVSQTETGWTNNVMSWQLSDEYLNAGDVVMACVMNPGYAFAGNTQTKFTISLVSMSPLVPPTIVTNPVNISDAAGSVVSFTAVASGTPPLNYQWQFNGTNLDDNGRISGSQMSTLCISNAQCGDVGEYAVIAANACGSVTSSPAGLIVLCAISASTSPPAAGTVVGTGLFACGATPVLTARPNAGYTFGWWSENGLVVGVATNWMVTASSNRTLVANYTVGPPSFVPAKGTYSGLFYQTNNLSPQNCGSFAITTTAKGKFSGSLVLAGSRYSMSGQLDSHGSNQVAIVRHKPSSLIVQLQVNPADTDAIAGTVEASDGTWTADLCGDRCVFNPVTNPPPQLGEYTLVLPRDSECAGSPGGDGCGTLFVDKAGGVHLGESLADGARFALVAPLSKHGEWPLYASLYNHQGVILGWISFASTATNDLTGNLKWIKPASPKSECYSNGFAATPAVIGSLYLRPTAGTPVLGFASADLVLSGGNLAQDLTNCVTIEPNSQVISTANASLTFSLSTGAFRGSAPGGPNPKAKLVSFNGVVLQKQNCGCGWFPGTNECGGVYLGQPATAAPTVAPRHSSP
jgi:hypothetical protein